MTPTSGDPLLLLLTGGGVLCALAAWSGWTLAAWRHPRRDAPRTPAGLPPAKPSPAAAPQPAPRRAAQAAPASAVSRPAPADRLMSLVDLMQQQELLVAIGQPLRAVQLLQSAAAGSQGDCVLPWLALLALQRSLGDAEGFQRAWSDLQQRLGPVPSGALLQCDGETAALERDDWLARAVAEAWASDDPVPALHDLLFAPPRMALLSLEACQELLLLAQIATQPPPLDSLVAALQEGGDPQDGLTAHGLDLDLLAWGSRDTAAASVRAGSLSPPPRSPQVAPAPGAVREPPDQPSAQELFDAATGGERLPTRPAPLAS